MNVKLSVENVKCLSRNINYVNYIRNSASEPSPSLLPSSAVALLAYKVKPFGKTDLNQAYDNIITKPKP